MNIKILGKAKTALERQVWECILIQDHWKKGIVLLNIADEYNRCLLPEIAIKEGNKISTNKSDNDYEREGREEGKALLESKIKRIRENETENNKKVSKVRKRWDRIGQKRGGKSATKKNVYPLG